MSSGPNPKALDALGSLNVRRVSGDDAGYMELGGALKDADCEKVEVDGGVSSDLGCCDLYEPANDKVKQFKCGVCKYVESA